MHPITLKKIIPVALILLFSCISVYAGDDSDDDSLGGLAEQLTSKTKLTQDLTLCRSASGTVVAQYADTLSLQNGCKLKLRRVDANTQVTDLFDLSKIDGYKSHVTASSVYVYDTEENKYGRMERPFTTALDFPEVTSKKDLVIDWASNQSLRSRTDFFKRKSNCGNGHSEPQLTKDFNALWVKNSASVVKHFVPQTKKEKDSAKSVVMCGCNLYGSFDMCNTCLSEVVTFRKQHQQGQTSVAQAVRDELKDQFQGDETDAFVVSYHSYCPYSSATYHAEDETSLYPLGYSTEYRPRKDIFEHKSDEIDDTYTLSQAESLAADKDTIYSHVHMLSGKKASRTSGKRTFIF
ncbi:MAG: hypothetical protein K2Q34_00405 [Alphaproteobacteria bacterium]|nr:hypothetical protein [Alphaproteobacteria bacterium]